MASEAMTNINLDVEKQNKSIKVEIGAATGGVLS
jgi:hypothetical protein